MSKKPCVNCPDPNAPSASQIYYLPNSAEKQLSDLQHSIPTSRQQRQFQRPVVSDDGSIEYPRLAGDTTPPDDIDGYERDSENPWRFKPRWLPCMTRAMGAQMKENGCIQVVASCNNSECSHFQKPVSPEACRDCKLRRED